MERLHGAIFDGRAMFSSLEDVSVRLETMFLVRSRRSTRGPKLIANTGVEEPER